MNAELVPRGQAIEVENHAGHVRRVGKRLRQAIRIGRLDGDLGCGASSSVLRSSELVLQASVTWAPRSSAFDCCGRDHEEPRGCEHDDGPYGDRARSPSSSPSAGRSSGTSGIQVGSDLEVDDRSSFPVVSTLLEVSVTLVSAGERREARQQASDVGLGVRVSVDHGAPSGAREPRGRRRRHGRAPPAAVAATCAANGQPDFSGSTRETSRSTASQGLRGSEHVRHGLVRAAPGSPARRRRSPGRFGLGQSVDLGGAPRRARPVSRSPCRVPRRT